MILMFIIDLITLSLSESIYDSHQKIFNNLLFYENFLRLCERSVNSVFTNLNLTECSSDDELTKNILRDDNSLLCRRLSERWRESSERLPEGKYEFISFTFHMKSMAQIICKKAWALLIGFKAGDKLSNLLEP
jgi:hypothetical protein